MPIIDPSWSHNLNPRLSFMGFVITVYVLIEVRRIKSAFLARARLTDLIKDLEKVGTALNSAFVEWPSQRHEARSQIKIAAMLLKELERKALERVQARIVDAVSVCPNSTHHKMLNVAPVR